MRWDLRVDLALAAAFAVVACNYAPSSSCPEGYTCASADMGGTDASSDGTAPTADGEVVSEAGLDGSPDAKASPAAALDASASTEAGVDGG